MTDTDFPFLDELRRELRRVANERANRAGSGQWPRRAWRWATVPALVAIGAIAYVVLTAGSTVTQVPVVGFSGQASAATVPVAKGTQIVGDRTCVKMSRVGAHLPPLVRSDAAPDHALVSELAMLRRTSTPLDQTSLGHWDRYPLLITTAFDRYARVFNASEKVRVAILPVTYCNQTQVAASGPKTPGGVYRETLRQGLVMLVLSNRGEHPPVFIGSAQQINDGPGLAGLDVSNKQGFERGWLQITVVPDGVAKVVMRFAQPSRRHPQTVALDTAGNVGIAVRRYPYSPASVYWYSPDGRLMKKFVERGPTQPPGATPHPQYQFATNRKQVGSPALVAQANALYRPVRTYEDSITASQLRRSTEAKNRAAAAVNACDRPYARQLFIFVYGTERAKLSALWGQIHGMQEDEASVGPVATQLRQLTATWAATSLKNQAMNNFAHATAAEINETLNAPPINTCAFVRAVAAHHFSYRWARNSAYAKAVAGWSKETRRYGNQASSFWRYVQPPLLYANTSDVYRTGGPGWRLFTPEQTSNLANLAAEND